VNVHRMCVYNPIILRTNSKKYIEKKKRQTDLSIASFCALSFCDTIHVGFVFFVSLCISNLVLKTILIVNTHLVNTHHFKEIFRNL
jgi:hypothetical protein